MTENKSKQNFKRCSINCLTKSFDPFIKSSKFCSCSAFFSFFFYLCIQSHYQHRLFHLFIFWITSIWVSSEQSLKIKGFTFRCFSFYILPQNSKTLQFLTKIKKSKTLLWSMYSLRQQLKSQLPINAIALNAKPTLITSVPQTITQTKIQVVPICDKHALESRERLRAKINESRSQRRLRVNWSALNKL